jgi:hypothetical protein
MKNLMLVCALLSGIQTGLAQIKTTQRVGPPRKINVVPDLRSHNTGETLVLDFFLMDIENRATVGNKDFDISVTLELNRNVVLNETVRISRNSKGAQIKYRLSTAGLLRITAKNNELIEGSAMVKVNGKVAIGSGSVPSLQSSSPFRFAKFQQDPSTPYLNVELASDIGYLANGIHEAVVSVTLEDPMNTIKDSIQVHATTSGATGKILSPNKIYVNRTDLKEFKVVSTSSGKVKIHISIHNLDIPITNNNLEIRFTAPVAYFRLTAAPSNFHLLNQSKIIATFYRSDSTPVSIDEPRMVTLSILDGDGELSPDSILVIKNGAIDGSKVFKPNGTGYVRIKGSSLSLLDQELPDPINVGLPGEMIKFSVIGSVAGSIAFLIFANREERKKWLSRTLAGIICGLLFYWSFLVGLRKADFNLQTTHLVLAAGLSCLGGYFGKTVFTSTKDLIENTKVVVTRTLGLGKTVVQKKV